MLIKVMYEHDDAHDDDNDDWNEKESLEYDTQHDDFMSNIICFENDCKTVDRKSTLKF